MDMDKGLFHAPLCLFCAAAALSFSLPAALLLIAVLSGTLLLAMLCDILARPAGIGWRMALSLLLCATVGTGIWLLLTSRMKADFHLLFLLVVMLCGPAAIRLADSKGSGLTPLPLLRAAGVLLLTGAVRELLSSGSLFHVRLFPAGLSDSFGLGAAGVVTAGLLLLLAGAEGRHFYRLPLRQGGMASLTAALRTAAAGLLPAVLLAIRPDLPGWLLLLAVTVCTGLSGALGLLFMQNEAVRSVLADGVTAAAGIALTTGILYMGSAVLLAPLWAGGLAGIAIWLWTGIFTRIDSVRMPAWSRGGPAALVTAGLCLFALSPLWQ